MYINQLKGLNSSNRYEAQRYGMAHFLKSHNFSTLLDFLTLVFQFNCQQIFFHFNTFMNE